MTAAHPQDAPGSASAWPSVSVIVCAHTTRRWANLKDAVASISRQTLPALETVVVIDFNDELERLARAELTQVLLLPNTRARGLSGARQTGADAARGTILAFLDDDAAADPDWLERLVEAYADPRVLGVGGTISPAWEGARPTWFPPEFDWVIGCTYAGMPLERAHVRNPIGANMSMRATVFEQAGAFDPRLGRAHGSAALTGSAEETEFCIRAARAHPGSYWIFEPLARVEHAVPVERATFRYFARRCWVEGTAKALLAGIAGSEDGLSSERAYVRSVLPRAVVRDLARGVHGDRGGIGRAGAIAAGLAITVAAYVWTRTTVAARMR
jgi:glycosyltransferase involved in cell wall biosynthesis